MRNMNAKQNQNDFLYAVKAAACFFVVLIHARFPGRAGDTAAALARFGVPMFFAISGLFLSRKSGSDQDTGQIRGRIRRILPGLVKVTLLAVFCYTLFSFLFNLAEGLTVEDWLREKYNLFELSRLVLFHSGKLIYDHTYTYDHLWYLLALIYVYVAVYCLAGHLRKLAGPLCLCLMAGLFAGNLLRLYYPVQKFGISISTWYVLRNWLFVGMPFFLMGYWLDSHAGEKTREGGWQFGRQILGAGFLMTLLELHVFGELEVYLGSVLMVSGILVMAQSMYGRPFTKGPGILARIGREDSALIYLLHVAILAVLDHWGFFPLAVALDSPDWIWWIRPVIVLLLSIGSARLLHWLKRTIAGRNTV